MSDAEWKALTARLEAMTVHERDMFLAWLSGYRTEFVAEMLDLWMVDHAPRAAVSGTTRSE